MHKRLELPDVTLVISETMENKLAKLAVEDCLYQTEFGGGVLVLTNEPKAYPFKECRFHIFPGQISKMDWARAMWFTVPPLIHTSHMLMIQWDSWIWNADLWRDEFLEYDLIGAPWWYKDGKNVGNTGFGLKTTRLARYIRDRRIQYPCDTGTEDDLLCRTYRPRLEAAGFTWAPERLAHEFSTECCPPNDDHRSFGFHGAFNFGKVLADQCRSRILERARLMFDSPYLTKDSGNYIMKAFCERNPEVVKELVEAQGSIQAAE